MITKMDPRWIVSKIGIFSVMLAILTVGAVTLSAQETAAPVETVPTADAPTPEGDVAETPVTPSLEGEGLADAEVTAASADSAEPADEINHADNTWMMVSAALVLLMTGPGLMLFYGGLVRKKNVLSVFMQCVFLMGLMSIVWVVFGYTLSFGGNDVVVNEAGEEELVGGPIIGNGEFFCLNNVQMTYDEATGQVVTPSSDGLPTLTHMLFQGMFLIITPALICGAFAERMKFSAMAIFMVLWAIFVYCPLCHWVWDGGILAFGADSAIAGGALDFAGGTVVHISSGVSALICALLIGKRIGFGTEPMPPHNMTYTAMGAVMLWVGWFGFNAGSALSAGGLSASAFAVTHLGAAGGAISWAAIEWIARGKPTVLGACSGLVAGLVCVTPAAGFIQPMSGVVMGLIAGVFCYYMCTSLKKKFGYDDSLDAFGVHGMGGTLGAILTGVFASAVVTSQALPGDVAPTDKLGLLEGGTSLLVGQIVATLISWIVAAVATFIILKVLDMTIGLRVSESEEIEGLDLSQHNEEGYIFL